MKVIFNILIFISLGANAQLIYAVAGQKSISGSIVTADSAKFNFSLTSRTQTGFANPLGNPHSGVISVTQGNITVSSRATNLWTAVSSASAAQNAGQATGTYGSEFPQNTILDYWFSNQTSCADGNEQLAISGLTAGAQYTIEIMGSRSSTAVGDATRNVIWVVKDNVGRTTQTLNIKGNTQSYVTFSHQVANSSGIIYVGSYGANDTGGAVYGYFNALIIRSE